MGKWTGSPHEFQQRQMMRLGHPNTMQGSRLGLKCYERSAGEHMLNKNEQYAPAGKWPAIS